ncbi:MAG: hypothetical protein ACOYL6_05765 [Bacteriovoracaceae bacterium]
MPFILLFLSVVSFTYAQENNTLINISMNQISGELDQLLPFLIDSQKFSDSKNEKEVKGHLSKLVELFKGIKKHPVISSTGFSLSRDQIETQLQETSDAFSSNHKDFARHKLNSTLGLCISCHTQMPSGDKLKLFKNIDVEKNITSTFEKGEFYFITREFPKAMENYDRYINQFSAKDDRKVLETVLNHKLTYFTRIQRQKADLAVKSFEENMLNKELPETIKIQIKAWIKDLKKKVMKADGKEITETEMKKYLSQVTKNNEDGPRISLYSNKEAMDLKISGILFEYLNNNPQSKLVPEILYNLAVIDKRMNFNIFYSMGDLYLKECMDKYPDAPIAKFCYQEYEDEKILSYTGSAGTSLPSDVKKELENYRSKLKIKP